MFTVVFQRPVNNILVKGSEKTRGKTRGKIIRLIKSNKEITITELAKETEISEKGIEYHLTKMKKEKIIIRVGSDKGGYRVVNEPIDNN